MREVKDEMIGVSEAKEEMVAEYNPPTIEELAERREELEENGITVGAECTKCDGRTETIILPGESTRGTLCVDCLLKLVNDLE